MPALSALGAPQLEEAGPEPGPVDGAQEQPSYTPLTNETVKAGLAWYLGRDFGSHFEVSGNDYGPISRWDMSGVTNLDGLGVLFDSFMERIPSRDERSYENAWHGAQQHSPDISNWNVSGVTSMERTFKDAKHFVCDLSRWDVSSVTNMLRMFEGANAFDSDLSGWDVSNVTDMRGMFAHAHKFTSDLSKWKVGQVTNMSAMFHDAVMFRSDLSDWDVSSVTSMAHMFLAARQFESDLSHWDVRQVTTVYRMFDGASKFVSDLSRWKLDSFRLVFTGEEVGTEGAFGPALHVKREGGGWEEGSLARHVAFVDASKVVQGHREQRSRKVLLRREALTRVLLQLSAEFDSFDLDHDAIESVVNAVVSQESRRASVAETQRKLDEAPNGS